MTTYTPKFMASWYDRDYHKQIKKFQNSNIKYDDIKCIILPHAGYKFTQQILAEAYEKVNWRNVNKIFILCTLHNVDSNIYLPSFQKVDFGEDSVQVNTPIVDSLFATGLFKKDDTKFNTEHAFELQLPYVLTHKNDNCTIIPMLVGAAHDMTTIASKIIKYDDASTLFIVSTDFTHYGKQYGFAPVSKDIKKYILNKNINDARQIILNRGDYFLNNDLSICGIYAIVLWTKINNKKYNGSLVAMATSADNEPENADYTSVSYLSFIFRATKMNNGIDKLYTYANLKIEIENNPQINIMKLCHENIALIPRASIILYDSLSKPDKMLKLFADYETDEYGVFVSMYDNDELQGCIGTFADGPDVAKYNLYQLIVLYTFKTIYQDDRFVDNILRHIENYSYAYTTTRLTFKVNLLGKKFKIKYEDFWSVYIPCVHGIILKYLNSSATFLPNVMLEQKWLPKCTRDLNQGEKKYFEHETFNNLIRKMGYTENWFDVQDQCEIYLYEGKEFDETINYHEKYKTLKTNYLKIKNIDNN